MWLMLRWGLQVPILGEGVVVVGRRWVPGVAWWWLPIYRLLVVTTGLSVTIFTVLRLVTGRETELV